MPHPDSKHPEEKRQPQTADSLYLDKLTFDPALNTGLFHFFITRFRVVALLIVIIIVWGSSAFQTLPRERDPEVKIAKAVVTTTYPGASPADIEELITKKIETQIVGLKGIDSIDATSYNSASSMVVTFTSNTNLDDDIRNLKDAVTTAKKNLPDDLLTDPVVSEISISDAPIITGVITGTFDGLTLGDLAKTIKDEVEKIPGVREAQLAGQDVREFRVDYDPNKLISYGLTVDTANAALKAANADIPGGTFEGDKFGYSVRSDGRFFAAKDLASIPILHTNGSALITLGDIATIQETAIKRTVLSRLSVNGSTPQSAITINIIKRTGGSIIDIATAANQRMQELVKPYEPALHYTISENTSDKIKQNFDQLTHDLILTVLLVGGILFLAVGVKEAFVAALAVPLVFSVAFGVMQLTGITLNFLSLFALILSLGMLVDDAIVVVSATKQYLRSGKFTPEEAVLLVLRDFRPVLIATTMATVWAFLPLLMSSGIIGEYIKSIPIVVSVTLSSSLLIALFINHPLAAVLERLRLTAAFYFFISTALILPGIYALLGVPDIISGAVPLSTLFYITIPLVLIGSIGVYMISRYLISPALRTQLRTNRELQVLESHDDTLIKQKLLAQGTAHHTSISERLFHGILSFHPILPLYGRILDHFMHSRTSRNLLLGSIATLFIIAVALPATGIVGTEFFPQSDQDIIYINVEGAVGQNLDETDTIVKQIEDTLIPIPQILNFTTTVGRAGVTSRTSGGGSSASHLASITIKLTEPEDRTITSFQIADRIRTDVSSIKNAKITVASLSGGPPAGAAFDVEVSGDDLSTLETISNDFKALVAGIPGVLNTDTSMRQAPAEYTFALDHTRLELYDLTAAQVGGVIRTAIAGTQVTKVLRGGDEIDVNAYFAPGTIQNLADIQNLQVINKKGQPVFIRNVATVTLTPSLESIRRLDQKRTVSVTADVDATASSTEVMKRFMALEATYAMPTGYTISSGGQNQQNNDSVKSILAAMKLAGALIIATLIIQFNSVRKTFIVLMTIPLALIGVFFGMALFRLPLSFPGLIGLLALFGIVVKNAIILIDKINLNLRIGIPFNDAIVDAGKSRLEAIVITSLATIFGLIPVTFSDATWMALGSAIIFGLSLSSFLTLFVVPVLFRVIIGEHDKVL